ncbi:MAG: hypothetical protein AVDCRST_MAG29-1011, partial [uncultured Nocardioidaceae bacterium]
ASSLRATRALLGMGCAGPAGVRTAGHSRQGCTRNVVVRDQWSAAPVGM